MSDKPVLVTGGAGFIGSNLVDARVARGVPGRVLDTHRTGRRETLAGVPVVWVTGPGADPQCVDAAVRGCRAVVHLAAVASVQASVEDPLGTHRSNLIGTLNVCEAMRRHGVRRVLFSSSAAVYGNNGEGTAIAEDTAKAPLTPYAADKLASEHYLDFYRRQHGLEPVVFRFFNVYGPRQDPSSPYSGVISIFTERARAGLPVTLFGDGGQTRDFIYVGDLVSILERALWVEAPEDGAINVGLGRSTTLNALLDCIAELLGVSLEVVHAAPRPGDIRHSRADCSRLQARFPLPHPVPMRDGLARLMGL